MQCYKLPRDFAKQNLHNIRKVKNHDPKKRSFSLTLISSTQNEECYKPNKSKLNQLNKSHKSLVRQIKQIFFFVQIESNQVFFSQINLLNSSRSQLWEIWKVFQDTIDFFFIQISTSDKIDHNSLFIIVLAHILPTVKLLHLELCLNVIYVYHSWFFTIFLS